MRISAYTRPIGLIGCPIGHSLSPKLHNALYPKYGINCVYLAFNTETEQLGNIINAFKALSFVGFNITVPHKQNVLKYIDALDKEAEVIGAVNTVKIENGTLLGFNTDGSGFIGSLKHKRYDVQGMEVLVLGAGGSARAICAYLAREGVNKIQILNRTESNAVNLAKHIKKYYPFQKIENADSSGFMEVKFDMIINTTSVGMWPHVEYTPLDDYKFGKNQIVVDIIYNPKQTKLLKDAYNAGANVLNGLDMFVGQAAKAIEILTGITVDHDYALEVLSDV